MDSHGYIQMPLIMGIMQCFILADATKHCQWVLLECFFQSASLLTEALAQALNITEEHLFVAIQQILQEEHTFPALVINNWLQHHGISHAQYIRKVLQKKGAIDGLLIWMAAWVMQEHLNVFHTNSI